MAEVMSNLDASRFGIQAAPATVMVPGAASMGKSYGIGVFMMLDWLRDPEFTNVQVVGPSEGHLERNLFSHLVKLHRSASIPLPGAIRTLEISLDSKDKSSGIFGVVVPIGKKAAGRLQGVKIVQRPKIHPQLGPTTRLRVVLEEAENIPIGIWEDVQNIVANASGPASSTAGLVRDGPITDFVRKVALPLHLGNKTTAAGMVAEFLKIKDPPKNEAQAIIILSAFLQFLLDGQRYVDAASLLWPPSLFSGEPRSVGMIWNALFACNERFKCVAPFNPKDPNSQCAVRCAPVGGFGTLDIEKDEMWMSARGWQVVRLDAEKSENVLLGYEKFVGLQTKDGLERSTREAGGVGTPGYYSMCRGWFPPLGVDLAVIPQHLVNDLFGEYRFSEAPRPCAGVDVALEGGDNAIMIIGRTGLASGYTPHTGAFVRPGDKAAFTAFKDAAGQSIRRTVIQIDQIFTLPKGKTQQLVEEIRRTGHGIGLQNWNLLGVDRTGNGAGVHDLLPASTVGVNGSQSPTARKIVEEDRQLPADEYSDLLSEIWYALRKYIEFGFLKLSPNIPADPIVSELTGRRALLGGKTTKVEPKKAYRSRGNKSPDRADALTILVHAVRLSLPGPPSIARSNDRDVEQPFEARIGCTDRMDYL